MLPELEGKEVDRLDIAYRRFDPGTSTNHLDLPIRWLQELFPGDEIAAQTLGIEIDDVRISEADDRGAPIYQATANDAAGAEIGCWECDLISYPLPFLPNAPGTRDNVMVTTGGFIAWIDGERIETPVETDLDQFWRFWQREVLPRVIDDVRDNGGFQVDLQPFFGSLDVDVWLSAPNQRLGIREENDSAAEALHEDIYFNTLDTLEVLGLETTGEKTSAPGPVVPVVHVVPGIAPRANVKFTGPSPRRREPVSLTVSELTATGSELVAGISGGGDLESVQEMRVSLGSSGQRNRSFSVRLLDAGDTLPFRVPLQQIIPAGDDVDGRSVPMNVNIHSDMVETEISRTMVSANAMSWVEDETYQGRPIPVLALRSGAPGRVWSPAKLSILKPTALIIARHHANEISSTNAALKLAELAVVDPGWRELCQRINVVIIPYENADGAALHARLASDPGAATWKHHPARYNALGHEFGEDFLNPATPFGEARVRPALWNRWLPDVIVDNHGVPSHEWVQPFAGFGSPPRFRVSYWIPQALIYGIVRYVDDPDFPEHRDAAIALREAVSAAVADTTIGDLNREIGSSYRRWGQDRSPEHFPGEFHNDMLWHFGGTPPDPAGRGFNLRYPRTTVLSWVTEVNDETATGAHLETVSQAHLAANRAMLDLISGSGAETVRTVSVDPEGRTTVGFRRKRPLRVRSDGDHPAYEIS